MSTERVTQRYLLNSAVIPAGCYGTYRYRPATVDELRAFLAAGDVESRVGYQETLDQIAAWTGITLPLCTDASPLAPGDEAMVVRLKYRVRHTHKGRTAATVQPDDWEIGRLDYLATED